jgi:pimeloyl-ACP methyl ester carboxylesterase
VIGRYVTIEIDGMEYKVSYLHNGKGQPLVCQHTAGCHNHQWSGLLEDEEITKNYNVIAYDLPRHGKSDPPHNYEWWTEEYRLTKEHYINFIVALCDALELDDPIFMGSSFGGNIALQLALRKPDRFKVVIPVEAAHYAPGFYLDWWLTWHYYTQGLEAFKGDLYFYSVDHDLHN